MRKYHVTAYVWPSCTDGEPRTRMSRPGCYGFLEAAKRVFVDGE